MYTEDKTMLYTSGGSCLNKDTKQTNTQKGKQKNTKQNKK